MDINEQLFMACRKGDAEEVAACIEAGASVNIVGSSIADLESSGVMDSDTPLLTASSMGCIESVKLLISHGADIEARDSSNFSPLIAACWGGYSDVAAVLIENKAQLEVEINKGWTALFVAVRFLSSRTPAQAFVGPGSVHEKRKNEAINCINLLTRSGANVECLIVDYPKTYRKCKAVQEAMHLKNAVISEKLNTQDAPGL